MSTINAGSEKTRRSYGSPASDLARATCSKSAELSTITLIPALASRPAKVVCNKLTCSPENEVRIVTDWPAGGDPGRSDPDHLGLRMRLRLRVSETNLGCYLMHDRRTPDGRSPAIWRI